MILSRPWRTWLTEDAARTIISAARNYHPVEIGGVLIGVRVGRRPWATRAVVVPSEQQTPTYYELPPGERHAAVDKAREDDGRLGYVGDWHSHPIDMGYSRKDLSTMRDIAGDPGAGCKRPMLLIARRSGDVYRLAAWQFTGRRLRPLRVIAAGPIPAPHLGRDRHRPTPSRLDGFRR